MNRDDLDLSSVHDTAAAQELELVDDVDGYLDYPLKQSKFQNVNSLLLFVTEAVGEGQSGIQHVNLKGVSTKVRHDSAFSERASTEQPVHSALPCRSPSHLRCCSFCFIFLLLLFCGDRTEQTRDCECSV